MCFSNGPLFIMLDIFVFIHREPLRVPFTELTASSYNKPTRSREAPPLSISCFQRGPTPQVFEMTDGPQYLAPIL